MQRQSDEAVVSWLDQQRLQDVGLPGVVLFELHCGVAILPDSRRRLALGDVLNALLGQPIRDRTPLWTVPKMTPMGRIQAQSRHRGCIWIC